MKIQDISEKWATIPLGRGRSYTSVRISSTSVPDIYLGLNSEGRRCLILKLPNNYSIDFQASVRQNLSLTLFSDAGWVVLTLLDSDFYDLFDDLIFSIFFKIRLISSPKVYVEELLTTYYKWSEFFEPRPNDRLSGEMIRGIFGEILVLNQLVVESEATQINEVLNSWKGPYDTNHDFVSENIDKEIKTRLESISNVRISSEYQLQPDIGKALELVVVTLLLDPLSGMSLSALVESLRNNVISKLGDYAIVLRALARKGLSTKNLHEYEDFRFNPIKIVRYDCCHSDFPSLVRSNVSNAISSVSYKLNIEDIRPFILSEKNFHGN